MEEVNSNWTSETVIDGTNFTISNLTSDAQYMIQVVLQAEEKDENIGHRKNIVYALIPATSEFSNYVKSVLNNILIIHTYIIIEPSLTPVLTEPIHIVNNSVTVKWEIHQENCSSLNGELLGFYVKLNVYMNFYYFIIY